MKLECLICGKNYSSLGHHLSLVHKVTKQDYIEKYDLPKNFKFTSDEYTQKMSKSIKENFWNEDRKSEAREKMLKQWEDEYLRKKRTKGKRETSLAAWRDKKYQQKVLSYRITQFAKQVEYNGVIYRGEHEAEVAKILNKNKIEFQYEKLAIPYYDKKGILRTHITDFYLPKYNLILEEKDRKQHIGVNEVLKQKAAIEQGFKYEFIIGTKMNETDIINIVTGSLLSNK